MSSHKFKPNPGPQTQFVSSDADILVYGGAAGSGKTRGALLDWSRFVNHPSARGVFFRRTYPMIKAGGGPWDEAVSFYRQIFGKTLKINESSKDITFPSGAQLAFRSMQHEKNRFDWQGAQLTWVCFDEGTHFSWPMVNYLISRLRSSAGMKTYLRVTCNPDAESWLAGFIDWWIDPRSGYPIPERGGVIRHMYIINDVPKMYASAEEAKAAHPDLAEVSDPQTVTFVPGKLQDTPQLGRDYLSRLMAQTEVEKERLAKGNWKITASDGIFKREWFEGKFVDNAPAGLRMVRSWDIAATEPDDKNDPDYTVGVKVGYDSAKKIFYIVDVARERVSPLGIDQLLRNCAEMDGRTCTITIPQDPGAAGKIMVSSFVKLLAGYPVRTQKPSGDKQTRAMPFASQAEHGNVYIVRRPWNIDYINELCKFPYGAHDDQVDATADAINWLTTKPSAEGLAELNRR